MAQKDYYEVLGVSKNATPDEITKKYRELVMKYHPDLHKDDADAARKMAEINEAYEVLSDPEKRAQYDRFGAVGEGVGAPGYGGGPGFDVGGDFFGGVEDILRNFGFGGFGGATTEEQVERRGSDIETSVTISFAEAVLGTKKDVNVQRYDTCPVCHGTGVEPGAGYVTCPTCKGSGVVKKIQRTIIGEFVVQTTCPTCHGTGKVPKEKCHNCGGTGVVKGEHVVTVTIPGGIEDGMRVRVQGQGNSVGHDAREGDLYVLVRVKSDLRFTRDKDKIYFTAHISVPDAVMGTTISVPLIEGGEEKVRIPAGTQNGTEFVIRGRGSYTIGSRRRGDLVVKVLVDIPTRLSSEEAYYYEKIREVNNAKK
ncbi:MAG: molecular chaperone DnaJ [Caldisericaceae bacterium]